MLVAYGTLFPTCVKAAEQLREEGLDSASSTPASPSRSTGRRCCKAVEELPLVVTVEEGTLEGGFGSAVLEAANAAGLDTRNIVRLGLPDRFVEHGERGELLAELGLDVDGHLRDGAEGAGPRGDEREWGGRAQVKRFWRSSIQVGHE